MSLLNELARSGNFMFRSQRLAWNSALCSSTHSCGTNFLHSDSFESGIILPHAHCQTFEVGARQPYAYIRQETVFFCPSLQLLITVQSSKWNIHESHSSLSNAVNDSHAYFTTLKSMYPSLRRWHYHFHEP